jgi:hypothetical protein
LLRVSITFMNVANSVLWRMAIILKTNKVNLFVSSVLFVFWYHVPKVLNTQNISVIQLFWFGIYIPKDLKLEYLKKLLPNPNFNFLNYY